MAHNVLITGGSGYLGGTLLARLDRTKLPHFDKLYAAVRTDEQAAAVQQYGALPAIIDFHDQGSVRELIIGKGCSIVFWLIDPLTAGGQVNVIGALKELKDLTGREVHFVHTTGANVFSSHAGAPTDAPLLDTDPKLYEIQKAQHAPVTFLQTAVDTNNIVIKTAEAHGVRSYIFIPCIVYGEGEGFGNRISIQTAAIVRAARAMRRVYRVDADQPQWPVCHLLDTTNLYLELLRRMLDGGGSSSSSSSNSLPDCGRDGYYLAASGSVTWDELYTAMAGALAQRNVIGDASVVLADDAITAQMAPALGSTADMVSSQIGGRCALTAEHGRRLGWSPVHAPEHILEAADAEVELILRSLPPDVASPSPPGGGR